MERMASKGMIGIVGAKSFGAASDGSSLPQDTQQVAYDIGGEIARTGCWLLCGGLTGVMEAVAQGAKDAGGITVGIIPKAVYEIKDNKMNEWPNPYIDLAIFTGLGGKRNQVIINSCDVVIALPGSNQQGHGTRSEIEYAMSKGVPIILHPYWKPLLSPIEEKPPLIQYFTDAKDAVGKAWERINNLKNNTTSRRPVHDPAAA